MSRLFIHLFTLKIIRIPARLSAIYSAFSSLRRAASAAITTIRFTFYLQRFVLLLYKSVY